MDKLIYSYLNAHFYAYNSDAGNGGVYLKNLDPSTKPPIDQKKLLNELSIVFSIKAEPIKNIINDWALRTNNVKLDFYWLTAKDLLFMYKIKNQ